MIQADGSPETCGANSCDKKATCEDSSQTIVCTCKAGHYSPSGDATTGKDCTARESAARIGVEWTAGSDYKFEQGKLMVKINGKWTEGALTGGENRKEATKVIIIIIIIIII